MSFPDPFDTLLRLQRALDMPQPDDRFGLSTAGAGAFPPVNVFQKDHDFVVIAELPGVAKDSLTIEVQKNHVRLAGQRTAAAAEGASLHRRERAAGEFDRTITFPIALDSSHASATCDNGILIITLPPAAELKPRSITVS